LRFQLWTRPIQRVHLQFFLSWTAASPLTVSIRWQTLSTLATLIPAPPPRHLAPTPGQLDFSRRAPMQWKEHALQIQGGAAAAVERLRYVTMVAMRHHVLHLIAIIRISPAQNERMLLFIDHEQCEQLSFPRPLADISILDLICRIHPHSEPSAG
jgi:hypothetical protein